jgi:3-oxoacyl-[acyl-carrier-protein] synthase III
VQQGLAGIALTGCGSAAPEVFLNNDELSQVVDTSDEWISSRTGIRRRHLAKPSQTLVDFGASAAHRALEMAEIAPEDIDLILLATSTPEDLFGTACLIQSRIGAHRAVAFDLTAACSGFVFGLVTAAQFLRTGVYRNVLLIGADVLSRWVDWSDRRSCVLFGDGAGAVVLQANERDRLLGFAMQSDGTQNAYLNLAYQAVPQALTEDVSVAKGTFAPMTMNGQEVYRFAVRRVPEIIEKSLFQAGLHADDLDWLLLHQANQRILDAVAQRLGIPSERVISNLAEYGNTSAASIPLALDPEVRSGRVKAGDVVAIAGFGAGLSWGAAIFEWGNR